GDQVELLGSKFEKLPKVVQLAFAGLGIFAAGVGPVILPLGAPPFSITAIIEAYKALQMGFAAGGAVAGGGPIAIGILALVAVLGIATIAWANYESATEKAMKINADTIKAQQDELKSAKELAGQAASLTEAIKYSAVEHEKMESVLEKLDPA